MHRCGGPMVLVDPDDNSKNRNQDPDKSPEALSFFNPPYLHFVRLAANARHERRDVRSVLLNADVS